MYNIIVWHSEHLKNNSEIRLLIQVFTFKAMKGYICFFFQFESFYNKKYSGRKLTWMHSFCSGKFHFFTNVARRAVAL